MEAFFANVKLKTGEELLCIVKEADPEEDYLLISHPIEVEEIEIPGAFHGLKIKSWMKLSHQTEFYLDGEELITVKEIKGFPVEFYKDSLVKLNQQEEERKRSKVKSKLKRKRKGRVPLDEDMGLLSSIDDARELLEGIFLLDSDPKES
jgi:hypothetical protein